MPEVDISVDKETKKVTIEPEARLESNEMIAELMILAGEGAARFAFKNQIPFMFMGIGLWDINPLIFIVSVVVGHLIVVALGAKDPHLSGMLQAFGTTNLSSKNLYRVKGNKFEP